jgi:hypothetical protein
MHRYYQRESKLAAHQGQVMKSMDSATRPGRRPLWFGLLLVALAALAFTGLSLRSNPSGAPSAAAGWFVAADTGLDFVHRSGARGELHLPEIMGGGAALLDYDGDGDLDIYLTSGNDLLPDARASAGATGRLWRRGADGAFSDVTLASGLIDGGYGMGVAAGDVDNDGDLDVVLTHYGFVSLFRNRGDGTFEEAGAAAGIDVPGWSTSAAFLDYDRDGWLDLYVARYVRYLSEKHCTDGAGRPDYCTPDAYPAETDVLLHNEGAGRFREVSAAAGLTAVPAAAGLGVACADFDGDGWIDIYVANDGDPNHLWINSGDGTFAEMAVQLGAAFDAGGNAEAGMGVVAEDLDGDGDVDAFVTNLDGETNTLYRNLGGRTGFEEATVRLGLDTPSRPWTGFGVAALDAELDGDLDLLVVNGRVTNDESRVSAAATDVAGFLAPYAEPGHLYLSESGGFVEAGQRCGDLCSRREIGRALASGDGEGDGDVDLLAAHVEGPARLYLNRAPRRGHWLLISAVDPALGRAALGAQITVRAGNRQWSRVAGGGGSYLASSDPRVHFGLGDAAMIASIVVAWPDGSRESFVSPGVDRQLELRRGSGKAVP